MLISFKKKYFLIIIFLFSEINRIFAAIFEKSYINIKKIRNANKNQITKKR